MDKLKDFIDKNCEAFNEVELPDGHFERFIEKLERQEAKSMRMRRWHWWTIPAVAAAVALLLYWQYPFFAEVVGKKQPYVCELHSEISELHSYYSMEMEEILMEMEEKSAQSDSPAAKELLEAGLHIRNSCRQFDMKVLPTLPCSDEGVFAVNQQYRNSLNSLQILKKKMK